MQFFKKIKQISLCRGFTKKNPQFCFDSVVLSSIICLCALFFSFLDHHFICKVNFLHEYMYTYLVDRKNFCVKIHLVKFKIYIILYTYMYIMYIAINLKIMTIFRITIHYYLLYIYLQVFHMCQPNGNYDSFLCPNGTIFNQQYFICDWWYNVDCAASPNFYALNEFIYQDNEDGKICESLFCIDDQREIIFF